MINVSNYHTVRNDAQIHYASLSTLNCSALKAEVVFNSQGFNHIIYRKGRTERDRASQIMRFSLLKKAYKLIGLTTTIQEYEDTTIEILQQDHKAKKRVTKRIQYWGIIAIIDDYKIKVILRKIGNGHVHFWSIVPAWVTNKTRDGKYIRTTTKGDPDSD